MLLAPGSRLGAYEVVGSLGAGGMGEVYRARDTRLNRDVALKVLPELFAADADRLARFTREAQTLAALNHPNIAHIHGLEEFPPPGPGQAGVRALAMELVDGDDLSDIIRRGPLPVADALPIAAQIANALEAAHEHGIVHRDLKPANTKVRPDGTVKVLDFGLAKAASPALALSGGAPLPSPTMTSPAMTAMGVVLGTAAYMAPEQARGKPVDRRADIWAFGVILMEMLTGRRLFDGETVSDVMVAVMTAPVDLASLPADVPSRVRELIARCLERDPRRRLRDIGEARVALESPATDITASSVGTIAVGQPHVSVPSRRWMLPWAIAGVSLALAAAAGALWLRAASTPTAAQRLLLEIGPPFGEELVIQSNAGAAVVSPDGSMVAFATHGAAGRRLYVRSLMTGEARALSGTEEASLPVLVA